jgi:hypothetical protein
VNPLITNYFAAEQAIVDRLKAEVPGIMKVYTPFDLQGVVESSQASPALHVVYSDDDDDDDGKKAKRKLVKKPAKKAAAKKGKKKGKK